MKKEFYRFFTSAGQWKNSESPYMRNQTSDLRLPRYNALPLSHRDLTVRKNLLNPHVNLNFISVVYYLIITSNLRLAFKKIASLTLQTHLSSFELFFGCTVPYQNPYGLRNYPRVDGAHRLMSCRLPSF